MQLLFRYLFFGFLIFSIGSCDLFKNEQRPSEIYNLNFTRFSAQPIPYNGYTVDQPIIINATTSSDNSENFFVTLKTSSRASSKVKLYPYRKVSSQFLLDALNDSDGYGHLIIKESNMERAFDSSTNEYTTTETTVQKTLAWLNSFNGVEIRGRILGSPAFSVFLDVDEGTLSQIRSSKNIDIIEPAGRAFFFKTNPNTQNNANRIIGLVGVINSSVNSGNFISVASNDTIQAIYVQPDKSILTTKTIIK